MQMIQRYYLLLSLLLALMRDASKTPATSSTSSKPIIYIYTACGKEISSIRVRMVRGIFKIHECFKHYPEYPENKSQAALQFYCSGPVGPFYDLDGQTPKCCCVSNMMVLLSSMICLGTCHDTSVWDR